MAEKTLLPPGVEPPCREYWEQELSALLARVDAIERQVLNQYPTTAQARRLGLKVYRMARHNPYLRAELGLTRD